MKKTIIIIFICIFFGAVAVAVAAGYVINEFYLIHPSNDAAVVSFSIEPGQSVGEIAANLKEQGLIDNATLFRFYTKLTKTDTSFKTGVYEVQPGLSMLNLVSELTTSSFGVIRATIIEGWTLRDIGFYFENKGIMMAEEIFEQTGLQAVDYRPQSFIYPAEKWKAGYDFLDDMPSYVSLEGYLFPDTYYFFKNATAEDVVDRMLRNFDDKLGPEWRQEIERQGKTIFEIVTMASIIEKEMYGLEDRKMVSDIFWKRIELGMPLQSDASVNYVTGKDVTRPSIEDTQVDSFYNTYKYPGLPLGPISNPGAEAIEAAIYPTPNDYYYFLNTPDGEIIYSKTHDEHVANKQKYLD